jgi:hypothetical protein
MQIAATMVADEYTAALWDESVSIDNYCDEIRAQVRSHKAAIPLLIPPSIHRLDSSLESGKPPKTVGRNLHKLLDSIELRGHCTGAVLWDLVPPVSRIYREADRTDEYVGFIRQLPEPATPDQVSEVVKGTRAIPRESARKVLGKLLADYVAAEVPKDMTKLLAGEYVEVLWDGGDNIGAFCDEISGLVKANKELGPLVVPDSVKRLDATLKSGKRSSAGAGAVRRFVSHLISPSDSRPEAVPSAGEIAHNLHKLLDSWDFQPRGDSSTLTGMVPSVRRICLKAKQPVLFFRFTLDLPAQRERKEIQSLLDYLGDEPDKETGKTLAYILRYLPEGSTWKKITSEAAEAYITRLRRDASINEHCGEIGEIIEQNSQAASVLLPEAAELLEASLKSKVPREAVADNLLSLLNSAGFGRYCAQSALPEMADAVRKICLKADLPQLFARFVKHLPKSSARTQVKEIVSDAVAISRKIYPIGEALSDEDRSDLVFICAQRMWKEERKSLDVLKLLDYAWEKCSGERWPHPSTRFENLAREVLQDGYYMVRAKREEMRRKWGLKTESPPLSEKSVEWWHAIIDCLTPSTWWGGAVLIVVMGLLLAFLLYLMVVFGLR